MKNNKYLFCYFKGNEPENESINFALSEDGFHFTALNGNEPVLFNELGTKCIRDPFVFRDVEGGYFIIGTDMKSADGWNSNHAMCIWHSDDMISWQQYPGIDMNDYLPSSCRTWAPEVFYNKEKKMYMIYWSNCQYFENEDRWTGTVIWYAYTKDFRTLETEPAILYAPPCGKDAIDGDIVEKDGTYYLYYKDENEKYCCYVYSDKLEGPYIEPENKNVTMIPECTEGCCAYFVGDSLMLIMDVYGEGYYIMEKSEDMVNFVLLDKSQYGLDLSARHGSMLAISDEEYNRLLTHYGR